VTEREYVRMQVAGGKYPENQGKNPQKLAADSLDNMGVTELLKLVRQYNADRNRGELNYQFIEWIKQNETRYSAKIADVFKIGNRAVQFTYYGMIYTILKWEGCYVKGDGKHKAPNHISYDAYCGELLNLTRRFDSGNVRKTLKKNYSHNYYLDIEREREGLAINRNSVHYKLIPVFEEIVNGIKEAQFI